MSLTSAKFSTVQAEISRIASQAGKTVTSGCLTIPERITAARSISRGQWCDTKRQERLADDIGAQDRGELTFARATRFDHAFHLPLGGRMVRRWQACLKTMALRFARTGFAQPLDVTSAMSAMGSNRTKSDGYFDVRLPPATHRLKRYHGAG